MVGHQEAEYRAQVDLPDLQDLQVIQLQTFQLSPTKARFFLQE
jgi:hypothetical protein